jgi:phosphoribosylanthranilate isomerase
MKKKGFVSISAITNLHDLSEIAQIAREEKFDFPIVIGYQVSHKNINQNVQNARQPKFSDLGIITKATYDYGFIPAFHYYTKDEATIVSDLERVLGLGISHFHPRLVQFNTLPTSREILSSVKEMEFLSIFKVAVANKKDGGYAVWRGEGVQDVSEGNVTSLVNQVESREDLISYAMFDASHGTNLDLELSEESMAVKFGREIIKNPNISNVGLVYAGGIKPSNVKQVVKSLSSYLSQGFSIDTESGVRKIQKIGDEIISDELDLGLVREYLMNVREVWNKNF